MLPKDTTIRKALNLTRQEERGFIVLTLLLVVAIGIRVWAEWYDIPRQRNPEQFKQLTAITDSLNQTNTREIPAPEKKQPGKHKITIPPSYRTQGKQVKLEINQADSLALVGLYGIGPAFAHRILAYRQRLGGFYSPEQLREIYGIADTTYYILIDQIRVDASLIRSIDINLADFRELTSHPYLKSAEVKKILYYRGKYQAFSNPDEISINHLMDTIRYEKLRPYLSVEPR